MVLILNLQQVDYELIENILNISQEEFKQKGYNHLVCNLKDEYKRKNRSLKTIEELDKEITNLKNKYKNGNHSSSKKRKAL